MQILEGFVSHALGLEFFGERILREDDVGGAGAAQIGDAAVADVDNGGVRVDRPQFADSRLLLCASLMNLNRGLHRLCIGCGHSARVAARRFPRGRRGATVTSTQESFR